MKPFIYGRWVGGHDIRVSPRQSEDGARASERLLDDRPLIVIQQVGSDQIRPTILTRKRYSRSSDRMECGLDYLKLRSVIRSRAEKFGKDR